ncbi:MAG: DUF1722 domain-containing protein [Desulfobacterales bacterium]|nr:DUF1722 domain-containing protein [Desulfobacterales bacterium]
MRIWDINPGYLNRNSLLGEHVELHAILSVLQNNKIGYSKHPETIRWKNCIKALTVRHELLAEEMILRGFNHKSPVLKIQSKTIWPADYIDSPSRQFEILSEKYFDKEPGRIQLTNNIQTLWAHHKYSVMARDYNTYKTIGPKVSKNKIIFNDLIAILVNILREKPETGSITNTLLHMWGYVSDFSNLKPGTCSRINLLKEIQTLAFSHQVHYLIHSTALGELAYWLNSSLICNNLK